MGRGCRLTLGCILGRLTRLLGEVTGGGKGTLENNNLYKKGYASLEEFVIHTFKHHLSIYLK